MSRGSLKVFSFSPHVLLLNTFNQENWGKAGTRWSTRLMSLVMLWWRWILDVIVYYPHKLWLINTWNYASPHKNIVCFPLLPHYYPIIFSRLGWSSQIQLNLLNNYRDYFLLTFFVRSLRLSWRVGQSSAGVCVESLKFWYNWTIWIDIEQLAGRVSQPETRDEMTRESWRWDCPSWRLIGVLCMSTLRTLRILLAS